MDADGRRSGIADDQLPVRRRLVDEVIATGVPAVSAAGAERRRLWPAFLYVLIPLIALVLLYGLRDSAGSETKVQGDGGSGRSDGAPALGISAQNIMFDTDEILLDARAETVVHFENRDVSSVRHNIAVYENEKATEAIFQGEIISGGTSVDYEFKAPAQGEYFFQCDVHPGMNGTVLVE
jgi:plastocyanin